MTARKLDDAAKAELRARAQALFDTLVEEHGITSETDRHIARSLARVMVAEPGDAMAQAQAIDRLRGMLPERKAMADGASGPPWLRYASSAELKIVGAIIDAAGARRARGDPEVADATQLYDEGVEAAVAEFPTHASAVLRNDNEGLRRANESWRADFQMLERHGIVRREPSVNGIGHTNRVQIERNGKWVTLGESGSGCGGVSTFRKAQKYNLATPNQSST